MIPCNRGAPWSTMGQWRHSSALSPSRSRNFCSPGPRYSMIGSSNRPTLPPSPSSSYSPHSSGTRLRHILERSSCIHRYWAPAVISRWIIYSKSSMRVAGQVRMISSSSLFLFFFLFPSKRILDGFIRGINNLSLSFGRDTLLWIFFFLKYVDEIYYVYR